MDRRLVDEWPVPASTSSKESATLMKAFDRLAMVVRMFSASGV
jgi:hypothetical protein